MSSQFGNVFLLFIYLNNQQSISHVYVPVPYILSNYLDSCLIRKNIYLSHFSITTYNTKQGHGSFHMFLMISHVMTGVHVLVIIFTVRCTSPVKVMKRY